MNVISYGSKINAKAKVEYTLLGTYLLLKKVGPAVFLQASLFRRCHFR